MAMNLFDQLFARFFKPFSPLPAGVYTSLPGAAEDRPYRLHLRLEADGSGLLIVNARTVLHLNQTAAEYCYHLVKETPQNEAVKQIARRYQNTPAEIKADFDQLKERITTLATSEDIDPVSYLGFERQDLYTSKLTAPYRLDCAVTYRTSSGESSDAPVERVRHELNTAEWQTVLDKAWQAGIPHVIFTGGEATLRDDLPALVAYAQRLGQVSGLLTDGRRLADSIYLNSLLKNGLDHLMLVYEADNAEFWSTLSSILAEDIYVCVHVTINSADAAEWRALVLRLAQAGVYALSLSAASPDYKEALLAANQTAGDRALKLVWDLPVPYSHLNPAVLENADDEEHFADGAGKTRLYVEPAADVLPAQGMADQVLGNLLNDPWELIWQKCPAE
ncbi:MAG: hypothetical protein LWX83_13620 [Anaerolineae bacterium]|nr:hypothetical protein [Anaerolineae bacterium]